ncbi:MULTISPECIES: hypothetical protein [unclassified Iodidimonas]|jgi:hypothetical protein|uniref:L-fucose/L-arabinose isomerase family protein n=1 Tax=unclassified Iodidimonas TaxID=2626145 RepID=UPI002482AAAD|nr:MULTISPECIES: hypothetical protein [unclassified Iodidimonas]
MSLSYAVFPLARPTFDVPFATEMKDQAFAALDQAGIKTIGPRDLLFDADAVNQAMESLKGQTFDLVLIMQITFTDATMTRTLADVLKAPMAIWAVPEPRLGGRLRLNALCGLNLAAHALKKSGHDLGWLYSDPKAPDLGPDLRALASPKAKSSAKAPSPKADDMAHDESTDEAVIRALDAIKDAKITVIGHHPDGFDTCAFDEGVLKGLGGLSVNRISMDDLFSRARGIDAARVARHHQAESDALGNLDEVDADQLDRSLRSFCALEDVQAETGAKSLAVRCWPEFFTDYGCAACGPVAMLNEARIPTACEADVHGAMSQLLLQELAGEPAWMTDLVDLDFADDTAVLWHCGSAPLSMRDPASKAEATIHTNRKMPLLHQYKIKPGRITIARISQARGENKMVIGGAEVIPAPMAFTGTSGTIRFDLPTRQVCDTIMDEGLEHHFAIAYGDHRAALRMVAQRLSLPVLELC